MVLGHWQCVFTVVMQGQTGNLLFTLLGGTVQELHERIWRVIYQSMLERGMKQQKQQEKPSSTKCCM